MDGENHFPLLQQAVDADSTEQLETLVAEYSLELCLHISNSIHTLNYACERGKGKIAKWIIEKQPALLNSRLGLLMDFPICTAVKK